MSRTHYEWSGDEWWARNRSMPRMMPRLPQMGILRLCETRLNILLFRALPPSIRTCPPLLSCGVDTTRGGCCLRGVHKGSTLRGAARRAWRHDILSSGDAGRPLDKGLKPVTVIRSCSRARCVPSREQAPFLRNELFRMVRAALTGAAGWCSVGLGTRVSD
eukprot:scaffold26343_cov59-Phaeocystis_antarctica.AAC.2